MGQEASINNFIWKGPFSPFANFANPKYPLEQLFHLAMNIHLPIDKGNLAACDGPLARTRIRKERLHPGLHVEGGSDSLKARGLARCM